MMNNSRLFVFLHVVLALLVQPSAALAQAALQQDKPIEITSDKLDVFQLEHKAIFTGNVIAVQGTTNMRSEQMIVFYHDSESKPAAAPDATTAPAPAAAPNPQGIYRIEAEKNVVFTTPTEVAIGDKGIYNVETDTIDLVGADVTLTRGQNILKGTKLNYNMKTGRSVLTGGVSGTAVTTGGKPARVHGLFVPKADPKADPKPASKP
jgi:lipopolysaccharide export system protein LptA